MGICQSVACVINVVDATGDRVTHNVSLQELKSFRTMSDMMRFVKIDGDRLYSPEQKEIRLDSQFQIQPVVVYLGKVFRYRVTMTRMY